VTGDIVFKTQMTELRFIFAADVDGIAVAGLKFAAWWWISRRGYLSFQFLYLSPIIGIERYGQEK